LNTLAYYCHSFSLLNADDITYAFHFFFSSVQWPLKLWADCIAWRWFSGLAMAGLSLSLPNVKKTLQTEHLLKETCLLV